MEITPAMVMQLRNETGLPMMECKQALIASQGDKDKAIEWLRRKGMGQVTKRAARETTEGRIAVHVDAQRGRAAIVELLCETAPVANTKDFIDLAAQIARHAAELDAPTPESVLDQPLLDNSGRKLQDYMHDAINRIRENIRITHVGTLTGHIGHYLHHNAQVGVLVEMSAEAPEALKADVCMQIAAMRPVCARREQVPAELVEVERRLATEQAQGKPANIIEKIVEGKLNRWYAEMVLVEQPFVKDDKKTVGQVLREAAPNLTVQRFLRYEVGQE
ncbi:MAG: translation elongation factor Ts [Phycisphaerae bacterium]|nr:translation elongation factor Ts [Phycisphaerae bacterium]